MALSSGTSGSVVPLLPAQTGPNNKTPAHTTSAEAAIIGTEVNRRRYLWVGDFAIVFTIYRLRLYRLPARVIYMPYVGLSPMAK